MTDVGATGPGRTGRDEAVLAARLRRLAEARTEDEVHAVERELLAETDNGRHAGDPEPEARR